MHGAVAVVIARCAVRPRAGVALPRQLEKVLRRVRQRIRSTLAACAHLHGADHVLALRRRVWWWRDVGG